MKFSVAIAALACLQRTLATSQSSRRGGGGGGGGGGSCLAPGPNPATPSIPYLPDPFILIEGFKATTIYQWYCRRQQTQAFLEEMELGALQSAPTSLTSSFSGSTLTINATYFEKSISFSVSIKYPSSGTAPYPALIAFDGGSLPQPSGVAIISYPENDIAQQNDTSSRGKGKLYFLPFLSKSCVAK
jgi:hypothetical protein